MAPLKFEDNMREKLEQRRIRPSEKSWKKLEQLLDEKEQKKKNKTYWWLGIAAGFIGILIIASVFVKSDGVEVNDPAKNYVDAKEKTRNIDKNIQVVTVEETEVDTKIKDIEKTSDRSIDNTVVDKVAHESTLADMEKDDLNHQQNIENSASQTYMAGANNVSEKALNIEDAVSIDSVGIQEKIIEIVAQVEELKNNNIEVTDEEIDNLLLQAQKEITAVQIIKTNSVNASDLLADVESELDETFKEKVFEALKTRFQKLKTSVVQRNN